MPVAPTKMHSHSPPHSMTIGTSPEGHTQRYSVARGGAARRGEGKVRVSVRVLCTIQNPAPALRCLFTSAMSPLAAVETRSLILRIPRTLRSGRLDLRSVVASLRRKCDKQRRKRRKQAWAPPTKL